MTVANRLTPAANKRSGPKKLHILGHNYAPEMTGIGPYTTDLSSFLASIGYEVTVLTTFPHYPRYRWFEAHPGIFKKEELDRVAIRRLRVILPRRSGALWRVIFDSSVGMSYLINSVGAGRPDAVVATVPTLQGAVVAALLSRLWRVPAVLLVQDLPVEAGLSVGMLRQGLGLRLAHSVERLGFRLAHRCVVISDEFRESLILKGVPLSKVTVIPNWVDLERVRPSRPDPDVRARLGGPANGFLLLHTGAMAGKQALHTAIEAAQLLEMDPEITTVLVGDGPSKADLEAFLARSGLTNVRIMGIQPADYFPKMLAAADALLLSQRADVTDAVLPSKLLAYMASGRPVIAAVNKRSAAARLVSEADCGLLIPPQDAASLARAVRRLNEDRELRDSLGANGRRFAESHFERSTLLAKWREVIGAAIERRAISAPVQEDLVEVGTR